MRFVEPKTQQQQSQAIVFRTREQMVGQRTELVNALRAHLYEFGYIAPQGIGHLSRLAEVVEDEQNTAPCRIWSVIPAVICWTRYGDSRTASRR
jgi:transposase